MVLDIFLPLGEKLRKEKWHLSSFKNNSFSCQKCRDHQKCWCNRTRLIVSCQSHSHLSCVFTPWHSLTAAETDMTSF